MPFSLAAPKGHSHITEREGAHEWPDGRLDNASWEDCMWVAAVEVARLAFSPEIPAKHYEAEALRADSGEPPTGGSNIGDLVRGYRRRYRWITGFVAENGPDSSFARLWTFLKPGTVAVVGGSMGAFPDGHRLRRFDPSYEGGHSVFIYREDDSDYVWWCDGLAPQNGKYQGERVSKADLARFVKAMPAAGYFVAPLRSTSPARTDPMILYFERVYDLAKGTSLFTQLTEREGRLAGIKSIGPTTAVHVVETIGTPINPDGTLSSLRAIKWTTAAGDGTSGMKIVYVPVAAVSNGRPVTDPTPFSTADLENARLVARRAEYDRLAKQARAAIEFPSRP